MLVVQAALGICVFVGFAWLVSANRSQVRWRLVLTGILLQFGLALVLLRLPWLSEALLGLNQVVRAVEAATSSGTEFVFGFLGGGPPPYEPNVGSSLYLFAFRVLPQILVFSVLVALFWYWRVLPLLVQAIGLALRKLMGLSGPVGMAAGASVFLGMAETPLVVRAYLQSMTKGELFTVMTCGMATVAGSIMVLYASVLGDLLPGALGHILAASFLNIIAAIYIAHLFFPEAVHPNDNAAADSLHYSSTMDAINRGTADGLRLAVNVGAMVLVFVALVALVNQLLTPWQVAGESMSLQRLLGWIFYPVAWLMGIHADEAATAGMLLGTKVIINELVAYLQFAGLDPSLLGDRARLIMTYGLCGFANFGSLGILIAGLTTLVPERRDEILKIGPMSLLSGTLATSLTGAMVGLATGW